MAGFSKLYVIGGSGGFMGADGVNPILAQILLGDGSRQWMEARYFEPDLGPLGALRTLIPAAPNHTDMILDACIAFFPGPFRGCPSFARVEAELKTREILDFHLDPENVPSAWPELREEAREILPKLGVWEAKLVPLGGLSRFQNLT